MGTNKNNGKWNVSLRLPPNKHGIRRFRRGYESRAVAKLVYDKLKAAIATGTLDDLSLLDPTQPEEPKEKWPSRPPPSGKSVSQLTPTALKFSLPSDVRFNPKSIPAFLKDFSGFINEHPLLFLNPGIYFLMQDEEIVYVGQANSLTLRIASHGDKKKFDRVLFIAVEKERLNFMEAYFIKKLNPPLNRIFPVSALEMDEIEAERPFSGHARGDGQ